MTITRSIGIHECADMIIEKAGNAWIIVDSEDGSVLCIGRELSYDLHMYQPMYWDDFSKAEKWVKSGCIAELQTAYTHLDIGFHKNHIRLRKATYTEKLEADIADVVNAGKPKVEEKKEFVVVEKLLTEHKELREHKNKIFVWLTQSCSKDQVLVQAYYNGQTRNLFSISEKGILRNFCATGVGIACDEEERQIKIIS